MIKKEDVEKALALYRELESLEAGLEEFKNEKSGFSIHSVGSWLFVPVASDIARQIGYNYFNEEIARVKEQLEKVGEPISLVELEKEVVRKAEEGSRREAEELNKKYEKDYGKWPKEDQDQLIQELKYES